MQKTDATWEIDLESGLDSLVGEDIFIQTVTYHSIGHVEAVGGGFVRLSAARVVFQSGNLSTALKTGKVTEEETVGDLLLNTAAIVHIFPWRN